MSIKINNLRSSHSKTSGNVILFCNDSFNTKSLKKYLTETEFSYINDLLKTSNLKKNLFLYELTSKKKIVLISIKKNLKIFDIENLGAELYGRIKEEKKAEYFIVSDSIESKYKNFLGHFLHGLRLKSYEFKKYKSKKEKKFISINIVGNKNNISSKDQLKFKALEEGTFYARDLVSEPGNVLHPDELKNKFFKKTV